MYPGKYMLNLLISNEMNYYKNTLSSEHHHQKYHPLQGKSRENPSHSQGWEFSLFHLQSNFPTI